jgi:hypothetical protein
MTKRSFYHSRSNTMTDRTNREKAHDVLQTVSEKSDADTVVLDQDYSVEAEAEFRESLKRAGVPADAELRFIHL